MNTDLLMVLATYAGLALKIAELILKQKKKKDTRVSTEKSHVSNKKS
ncbi:MULTISPECIES: hypothetical protein [Bacillus]|nr:hypothetical protein [Bacillus cabrialesii]MDU0154441.1 hypothetical protein [Bacillus cabrialesii]